MTINLSAISAATVFRHAKHPGEHFVKAENPVTGEIWDGCYKPDLGGFQWRIWLRSVERLTHIPFPAFLEDLEPLPN